MMKERDDISQLYDEHSGELRGFIARRVGLKEDVEDILQNVFYALLRSDMEENPIEQTASWLYRVAQNQIVDHYRKKKNVNFSQFDQEEEEEALVSDLLALLADESDSPEVQYLQAMIWQELDSALSELPEEQRLIFELNELEGFSFKDISESTGVPVNTLISRKHYAVLHLRKRLKDVYIDLLG